MCDRSDDENEPHFEEHDDYIVIGNEVFHKPFVEKPVSGKYKFRFTQGYYKTRQAYKFEFNSGEGCNSLMSPKLVPIRPP